MAVEASIAYVGNAAGRTDAIVTTPTGYRAVVELCDRDDCRAGSIKPCVTKLNDRHQHDVGGRSSVNAWLRHTKTHCHGWHRERVEVLAADVVRTYGTGRKLRALNTLRGRPKPGPMKPEDVADAMGMDVDQYRAELAKAVA